MLFPGSRIWYEGSAVDLANLTEEIKAAGFSGHIVLEFQDSLDLVICVGGEFLKVIEKIGRRLLSTKKYREIWGKCQIKPARMTIFELPPNLARRIRGLHGRRLLCSGSVGTGLDPERLLREQKDAGVTGVLDCVTPEGKLLLDFEGGAIVGCWYSEFEGLAYVDLDAFRAWHRGFLRSQQPSFFFVSETDSRDAAGLHWDEILMDSVEQVSIPLRSSLERLFRTFGSVAADGEVVIAPHDESGRAVYLMEGEVAYLPEGGSAGIPGIRGPGSILGLGRLQGLPPGNAVGRARGRCRYLSLHRSDLATVFHNSPALAALILRESLQLTQHLRARLSAYREEPRLKDMEHAVAGALLRHEAGAGGGIPAAELFRELTQILPLSLPEIDALFRRLVGLGSVEQAGGRVTFVPREL
jgi:hypothetical protein